MEGSVLSERRTINDRKRPGPDTFERRFSLARPLSSRSSRRVSDWFRFSAKVSAPGGAPFYASSKRKQFQRRYGRENIEPRDRLTQFRILETISRTFFSLQFPRLTAHMTNKTALSNGVGRRDTSVLDSVPV